MANSLKDILQIAGYGLDDKLISSSTISSISKIADLLPNIPKISEAGFECNLSSSIPNADFLVSFTTFNNGRKALIDYCESLTDTDTLYFNPVWQRVHDFSLHWANVKSPLYDNVGNIWLEFDVDNDSSEIPKPSFFFAPKGISRKSKSSLSNNDVSNNWVVDEALRLLFNSLPSNEVQQRLLTCFDSLPPNGEVFQIGVMLPRQSESNSVRLCVQGISNEQILDYISNIGWTSSLTELGDVLSELSQFVDVIRLNFAVKDVVYPKIGLECYIDKQPKNTPKWQLFFDYLVNNQLCTPEKANAVLEWPGYSEEKFHQQLWPINFAKASAFVPDRKSTIARTLHHIKIVYQPNQPLQAKAYLWFSHRWLSNSGLFQV